MVANELVRVDDKSLLGVCVSLPNAPVLMLIGSKGFIGCGYFSIEVADKVGHALAVVSGVSSFDDVLAGTVKGVSSAAGALGVAPGMSGREAARLLA